MVVTGGAGFLGSRLARELLTAGSLPVAGRAARPLSRLTLIDQAPAPRDRQRSGRQQFPGQPRTQETSTSGDHHVHSGILRAG